MLKIAASVMSEWQALLLEASDKAAVHLNPAQESYLVFLLMRYTERADWIQNALALSFLESGLKHSLEGFQEVGDQCLLLSGLFPARARRKNVPLSYFVQLGRSAYFNIARYKGNTEGELFKELSNGFIQMMDLLLQIRKNYEANVLAPLEALALYEETNSAVAKTFLHQTERNFFMKGPTDLC